MDMIDYIKSEFSLSGITLSNEQADKFLKLYDFMISYNKNVNLTAITGFEDVVVKHFIDSVLPFHSLCIKDGTSFIDVGTGAGFPSLPLLIYNNSLKCTMLEALQKRCVYLEQACRLVEVKADIVHGRAENYAKEARESFDIATARAVAAMPVLCEYCLPYVKVGGCFMALKSINEDVKSAEKAISMLGGEIEKIEDYNISNGDSRRLVVVRKISHTPTKYPRNPSMIKKKPL